ncbi:MAG: cardiolipin synthase [Lachnospiraceae bacterium]|nr:cardiolipin synthase [Lachnospiraceae bacterium]
MGKVIRRILAIIPAVIIQVLWMCILMSWLAPYATVVSTILSICTFLFVLFIIIKRDEGTYKILWLLVLLTLPVLGAVLYLELGNKRTGLPIWKRLQRAKLDSATDCERVVEEIKKDDIRLAQTIQNLCHKTNLPVVPNEQVTYYPLGDKMYPDMITDLQSATKYIYVEYFIIAHGKMWDSMVEILAKKAAQGVDVRVLYDDLGSISTYSKKDAKKLREMGIHCHTFNPLYAIKGTINYRDHRKMLVVDGKVAYSGGINLADEYINEYEKYGHWKDIGFRLNGQAVMNYVLMFEEFWCAFCDKNDELPRRHEMQPIQIPEQKDGYVISYYDSPLRSDSISNDLYMDLLSQAVNYAWFYTPYLMLGDGLMESFVRAAERGVDVRILMPGIPDKKIIFRMSHSYYQELLDAGVKIYEYQPGFVHAKACMVDDRICTIGTVNLDYRSLFLHFENNSMFYESEMIQKLKADYEATLEQCAQMQPYDIKKYAFRWFFDGLLRVFAPLC